MRLSCVGLSRKRIQITCFLVHIDSVNRQRIDWLRVYETKNHHQLSDLLWDQEVRAVWSVAHRGGGNSDRSTRGERTFHDRTTRGGPFG
jgi:hypothetical protein